MDVPYFNVIYSWKLSAKTLTNLIDLFNNIISQARQTSPYEHWLDQVPAAECQQRREADGRGKEAFSAQTEKNVHPQVVSLSCIFGFLEGSSLRWCSWAVLGLSCSALAHPASAVLCPDPTISTKCCASAHGCSVPCSPPGFPWDFKPAWQPWMFFRALPGTPGGAWGSNPTDGCVAQANSELHQKGQNPSVSTHHLPLAGAWLGRKAMRATASIKKSLRLFSESLQKSKSLGLQNKYSL